jgi:hypothetical protein
VVIALAQGLRVAGIDPGKTVGLCVYDSAAGKVTDAAQYRSVAETVEHCRRLLQSGMCDAFAIERPRIYSHGGNELADTIEQFGALWHAIGGRAPLPAETQQLQGGVYRVDVQGWDFVRPLYAIERRAVTRELSREMGEDVRGDAGVWSVLVELHGGRGVADRRAVKGSEPGVLGLLHGLPHARAALAVAWAAAQIETGQTDA